MPDSSVRLDSEVTETASQEPVLEWVTPEVTKLDLETAQQTGGIPG